MNNSPIVFFCQNNQWAISEPNERQMRIPIYLRPKGYGFPGIRVDGNDVLATYAVTKACLDAAREGQGPSLIEAFTYRMGAHTTSDDPSKYRVSAEVEVWKLRDPIARLRNLLARAHGIPQSYFEEVDAEAEAIGTDLRERCLALPDPAPESMFAHVYAAPHPVMERERAELAAYLASIEGTH